MKALYYCWCEHPSADIEQTFYNLGISYVKITYSLKSYDADADFEGQIRKLLECHSFQFIFTFDYFPVLSKLAQECQIPYASWVYDSPHFTLNSCTVSNSCNYLFLFDQAMVQEVCALGARHVFHLPLAVNAQRLNRQLSLPQRSGGAAYSYDVSFIGSLYQNNMYDQVAYMPERLRGYFDGIMRAQQAVWGYHFLEELIGNPILQEALAYIRLEEDPNYHFSPRRILTNILDKKITSIERIRLLSKIAQAHPLDLFTDSDGTEINNAHIHGSISYTEEMPLVFCRSKINLNITLRSITSGIPLRCLDIMGANGFLLSNYQPELAEYFIPGEDFVYFESDEDLLDKIKYFLAHEAKREEIAHNGWKKVQEAFSYEKKVHEMISHLPV